MFKLISTLLLTMNGCAIQYFDRDTGSQHLFGIGHIVMKVEKNNEQEIAVFSGLSTLGLGVGSTADGFSLIGGWSYHQSINILKPDANLQLIWPNGDWLNIKLGSLPIKNSPTSEHLQ